MKEDTLIQLEEMMRLIHSPEWRHWVEFLENRKKELQEKVNNLLGQDSIVEARIALALMRDADKQMELFRSRIKDIEKDINKKREI